ncbi:hypothetical protein J7T55_012354 [Diaporthe amygdali]|uniref:uncharacterized protein n=1 Tax=Phomopsis amygdali TaxID=1214568 RepID=UPI0022FDC67E|nr:uncharacterized protein J7T55_012354 [Diaporthe amygdali]KAJ0123883.1 hypothetical protein J7T55_012354 [Diaporthe amygdali]
MADVPFNRDVYDLCYQRSRRRFVGLLDDAEEQQRGKARLEKINNLRRLLDHLSRDLRRVLERRDALIFCLHFLNCVYDPSSNELRTPISSPSDNKALPRKRPDSSDEEVVLRARLESATSFQFANKIMIGSLKQLGDVVRLQQVENARYPEEPRLFFRAHGPESYTFYDSDVGFCCPRWLRERDFDKPSEQDFWHHVNGKCEQFESPYISMSESPWRILNYVRAINSAEVFIIDARLLSATRIQNEPTTTIANRHGFQYRGNSSNRANYITDTHWVARFWIPADCIIRKMSFLRFQKVCKAKGILKGTYQPNAYAAQSAG